MTISPVTVKFLGNKITTFRVMKDGEPVRVFETKAEAQAWIEAQ
jgi:hypothetical protein